EVLKKETLIKKVKTLIEEEFGEYDANKEKKKVQSINGKLN
ncbi:hypothetical protein LEP1GSC170_2242, partial [Leptospira interrogans serovar Bataviae str. HAI135]